MLKKLAKAKKEQLPNEKPATVKTHLRNMIIVPEMIGKSTSTDEFERHPLTHAVPFAGSVVGIVR